MTPDPQAAEDILHIAQNIVGQVFEDVNPDNLPDYILVALEAIKLTEAKPGNRLRGPGRGQDN